MKTRADLQEWMRRGCPVSPGTAPAPIPDPQGRCDLFTLRVVRRPGDGGDVRTTGNIAASCLGCDMGSHFGPMSVGSDRDPAHGVDTAVSHACNWMASHAALHGMPPAEAEDAFQTGLSEVGTRRWMVREWAAALLRGHHPKYFGMVGPKGAGELTGPGAHKRACGFYMLDKSAEFGA